MTAPSRLPIVQAPMAGGPSTPELAAAVNAAGGFGYVAGGYLTRSALAEQLDRTRSLTSAPIAVNLFVPGPVGGDAGAIADYAERLAPEAARLGAELGRPVWTDDDYPAKLDLLTRSGVHTVSFTFGCPAPEAARALQQAGIKVAVTVTNADEARAAAAVGADSLIVQGTEAGGHQGTFEDTAPNHTPLLDALTSVHAALDLPIVAAGGIASSADVAAALDAGATAVQIGTALLCTPQAATSAVHREALLTRLYADTVLTRAFSGRWARGLANRFARDHSDAPAGYPQVHYVTRPLRAAATRAGDPDVPNLWAGTSWRTVCSEPAAAVVARLADGL
jgi:nitronate monooxygenase